jgi:hypothetical protein
MEEPNLIQKLRLLIYLVFEKLNMDWPHASIIQWAEYWLKKKKGFSHSFYTLSLGYRTGLTNTCQY